MNTSSILFALSLSASSIFAEQPTLESLALQIDALERKVEQLNSHPDIAKKDKADSGKSRIPPLFISIPNDGKIRGVDGQELRDEELIATMKRILKKSPNTPVKISGDRDVKNQYVVRIIDLCQRAGAWDISFATDKPKEDEAAPTDGDKSEN